MEEHIGRTRILMRNGPTYCVTEDVDEVLRRAPAERFGEAAGDNLVWLTSVTGQEAFPPEGLVVCWDDVQSIQEISAEGWVWIKRSSELHYARQLDENPASERLAAAQERLVEELTGG